MKIYDATEQAYKNGYKAGAEESEAKNKELDEKLLIYRGTIDWQAKEINRQKATIDRQIKAIKKGYALVEEQKAEIEMLREQIKKGDKIHEEAMLNAEAEKNNLKQVIERLQKSGEEAVNCFTRMESLYKIKCKELEVAKSEAYREFAKEFVDDLSHMLTYDKDYIKAKIFKLLESKQKELTESNE